MKLKTFLASGALILSLAAIGSAKTWEVLLDGKTQAGGVMLPAGNYTVKLDNNQALFTSDNGKKFTVPVKVQQNAAPKKFGQTEVKTEQKNGGTVIDTIDLGGTTDELQFGE